MNRLFIMGLALALFAVGPAHAVCVSGSKVNLRSGPGTSYEKMWEVYKYAPLQKIGVSVSGDWYAVRDVDGDIAWISKKLVTDRFSCAVVKKDKVNVRTMPGISNAQSSISPAIHYDSFKILQRKGEWVKVANERGDSGWIEKSYLWIQ